MDTSPIPLIKAILPKVPLMGKTTIYHTLGLHENSKHWDLRTALTIDILRSFIVDSPPESISKLQRLSLRGPEIRGRIWVSRATMPVPSEDNIKVALFKAIEGLKEPGDKSGGYREPELLPVEAEWTGYRAGATKNSNELRCSEEMKYQEMMKDITSKTTVLYFHGGAYYLMDPATHRPTAKKLAKLTKGRCFSVRYRLAPQNPFPAALLDALVSYFTLLYPPPGAFHEPVDPQHIVFAGDSAGGNLSLVLLQTLLELRRQGHKIRWNGEECEIHLPAGLALCSPWADLTYSSESCKKNGVFDYLPPLGSGAEERQQPPPCSIWPANPPRKNIYAEDAVLCHPLVSPLAAKSWEGSCPIYIGTGTELLTDEDKFVAQVAATQGVPVVFEQYEAMPHCFAMVLGTLPGSKLFFQRWSSFITHVVEGEDIKTNGRLIKSKTLQEASLEVERLLPSTHDEVRARMRERSTELSEKNPYPMSKL
ncbi:alpha/beta hydrolase fold-domain-containing protein [Bisporella sp. PMI_857]|nr:alpha/beta hydrolase fold-domain-containing protein [Bisporella sp. PMI_857]